MSFRERAVVEHKAQTHFEGFSLLSSLFCGRYPAAHMYLYKGNVRHIQMAHFGAKSQASSLLARTTKPFHSRGHGDLNACAPNRCR
jgi:hypothetical protein